MSVGGRHLRPDTDHNAAGILLDSAAAAPQRPAVVDGDSVVSYDRLRTAALELAAELAAAGVEPGDRVAILLRRDAAAAAAFFGVLASGAVAVFVNEHLQPRQIEHILSDSGAVALVTTDAITERLSRPLKSEAAVLDVDSLSGGGDRTVVERRAGDLAQIIYTSGSTGLPKGVMISHANLWAGMRAVTAYLEITADDHIAAVLPFSFDYGLNQLLCAAGTGAALVIERSPIPVRIVNTLRSREVSVLAAVPPLWLQLLEVNAFCRQRFSPLRVLTNSGGRLPTEAVRELRRCQPQAQLVLMYGLTEAFRSTYLPPDRVDRKPTSIGQAIPGAEIVVVDEQMNVCGPGETGTLLHRGPTVALGYWNDPEATARTFRPDPFAEPGNPEDARVVFSGDLVTRDADGDLFFVGRNDAMIKTLGYRVSPDEVAEVLYASGQVAEAIVTSEPDRLKGSRIVAYVILKRFGRLDQVEAVAARELPRYMRPARIEARSELPRTASGKHDPAAALATR